MIVAYTPRNSKISSLESERRKYKAVFVYSSKKSLVTHHASRRVLVVIYTMLAGVLLWLLITAC